MDLEHLINTIVLFLYIFFCKSNVSLPVSKTTDDVHEPVSVWFQQCLLWFSSHMTHKSLLYQILPSRTRHSLKQKIVVCEFDSSSLFFQICSFSDFWNCSNKIMNIIRWTWSVDRLPMFLLCCVLHLYV